MLKEKWKIGILTQLWILFHPLAYSQAYWQQEVDYLIQASLDEENRTLHGHITMHYTNNSPNTLNFIYLNLMPNAYGSNKSALNQQLLAHGETSLQFAHKLHRGGIDSLKWKVNGELTEMRSCKDTVDIFILDLPQALMPGETIRLETPFFIQLPSTHISRIGYKDDAFYLTQWYPKPAVYDTYGWHPMSYLDKGEFFSELGNYEVHLTVPQNFVVAASGELITPEEIKALDTLAQFSQTYVYPKRRSELRKAVITPSQKNKTLTYRLFNAHDFAWVADPEFLLRQDTMEVENKPVILKSFVKRPHWEVWQESNEILGEAIQFFSDEVGPYQYSNFSLVDADDITGGDMEYPTMALINHSYALEEVIVHEVGHNWFYGVIASNERDEAWLDEGVNSFYESLFLKKKYPNERIHFYANVLDGMDFPYYQQSHTEYYYLARRHEDQPVKTPPHLMSVQNYYTTSYSKPASHLWYLYNICGEDTFRRAMQDYYNQWKFKHPVNGDLYESFKKYIGDKAEWFFDQAMIGNDKINYKITGVKKKDENFIISITNKGSMITPLFLETYSYSGRLKTFEFEGIAETGTITIPYDENIKWIALDNEMTIPDVKLSDNYIRIENGKRKSKPFRFNVLSSFENPYRHHIYFMPSYSFNLYDGFQLGLILHNYGLLPKQTEWFFVPMFGFNSFRPGGYGEIRHIAYFKKNLTDRAVIKFPFNIFSYGNQGNRPITSIQMSPQVKFIFDRGTIYSSLTHEVGLKNQLLIQQTDPNLNQNRNWKVILQNVVYYQLRYHKKLWDIQNTVSFEHTNDFGLDYLSSPIVTNPMPALKLYNELEVKFTYFKGESQIRLRVFAGTFLATPEMATDTRFRLSGWKGPWDYAFNEWYLGRSEASGFWSQQVSHHDGDFKINTFVGQTNKWLLTANLEWDIPRILAGGYVDIGTYEGAATAFPGSQAFVYNAGFYLRTPDRTLQIYFPIISSSDIAKSVDLNTNTYWERIRFTVQLQNLKIIETIRRLFI